MTIQREREKAMIDQLVDDNALEAQVHFLYPDTKRLLGVHGMRCLMVANPDPLEVKDQLDHPHNAALENALPLWVNFYRYEATADRGTPNTLAMQPSAIVSAAWPFIPVLATIKRSMNYRASQPCRRVLICG